MGARRTGRSSALDRLLTETDFGCSTGVQTHSSSLKVGLRQNQQPTQLMLIKISNIVKQVSVKTHDSYATSAGANNRTVLRRSVNVQPIGGVSRSAWIPQTGYPAPGITARVRSSSHTADSV